MQASYASSLAPGTLANRNKQAKDYLTFALLYRVPYLSPSVTHVCMYAQRLANKHAAPTSVKNYLSGAKTWVTEHSGAFQAFESPELARLVKGFVKNSSHVPVRAFPLSARHIRTICDFLDASEEAPLGAKPAILIGFSCFLRGSNLLSPTMLEWGGPHTLAALDIKESAQGLAIYIRSTKTRCAQTGLSFIIPPGTNSRYCPLAAWRRYKAAVRPWPLGPAFLNHNNLPLTPRQLVGLMRLALAGESDVTPSQVSMHSLRRGATHTAVDNGLSMDTIQVRGTWRSRSSMGPYLARSSSSSLTVPVSNLAD